MVSLHSAQNLSLLRNNAGFVLLVVMVFTLVFASLGMSMLELLRQQHKIMKDQMAVINTDLEFYNMLNIVLPQLDDESLFCRIKPISSIELNKKKTSWWQETGCHMTSQAMDIYFVVELLETDNCAVTKDGMPATAMYYRITFLLLDYYKTKIETTVARLASRREVCTSTPHDIPEGVRYWLVI